MASSESKLAPDIDWLYPELLSKDGLIYILRQRYIQEPNLQELEKEELLQLYYKYILPLPQRQYRQNRRGREMTKKQIIMAKKRRIEAPSNDEPPKKKKNVAGANNPPPRFLTSFTDPSMVGDRLKPPPTCIDPNRKVIKLGSGSKTSTPVSPTKSQTQDVSTLSKKIVKISMSPSESSEKKVTVNKTIKLINNHLTGNSDKTKVKENGDVEMKSVEEEVTKDSPKNKEESPQKKIKLKRISWP